MSSHNTHGTEDTNQLYDTLSRRSVLQGMAAASFGASFGTTAADRGTGPVGVDPASAEKPVEYVDPFIGTARAEAAGSGGEAMPYPNMFPGPTRPHGMVQLSPDTGRGNIAGYHFEDNEILGFSHTHVSGTGCFGLGNFLATPMTAPLERFKSTELNPTEAVSASFWFKTDGDMPGGITSVFRHDRHITPLQLWDGGETGNLIYFSEDADGFQTLSFDFGTYADDQWHHYAITYESGNRAVIYVDEEKVAATSDNVGSLTPSSLPWSIGAAVDRGGEYFQGTLDEITLFETALTADQVQTLADGTATASESTIFRFSFEESGVEQISDLAGHDHPGVVYGDPTWESGASGKSLAFDGDGDAVGVELPSVSSAFSHESETASPGYYAVTLEDYAVDAELTATDRVGVHRYTFPETDTATVALDASYNLGDSGLDDANVEIRDNQTIVGSQTVPDPFCSGAESFTIYFAAAFSQSFDEAGTWSGSSVDDGSTSASGQDVGAYATYATEAGDELIMKVGISYVSVENALANIEAEVPNWNFEGVRTDASETWNERLSRIQVDGDAEDKVKFYTSLYHTMLGPTIFEDANGEYVGMDDEVYVAEREGERYHHYQMFSLWDTFRAEHPLLNIIEPEVQTDAIRSLLDMYDHGGWLPKWQFVNRYTNVMIADHATSIIAESYMKGLRDYDVEQAYEAMYKNSTKVPGDDTYFVGRQGLQQYEEHGYIPHDDTGGAWGSVSTTLEDTYCDYAIAQVAKEMDKIDDYKRFIKRAGYYKNVFDPASKFMRPRLSDGSWKTPFDPTDWDGFTEGNSWSYTWHVLQDVGGLIDLMGKETFVDRLDHYFSEFIYPGWGESFSHYWQGNEPDHHYPYLYNYAGQPWKTQEVVQDITNQLYTTGPGGIPGNEDVGQMSAWFVLSSMGFYPVTPAQGAYIIGSPLFEKLEINLPKYHYGGGTFTVTTNGQDYSPDDYRYIETAHLNGEPHRESWFTHADLEDGGTLELTMGSDPNTDWGVEPHSSVDMPPSMSDD
jgi:predicted alpha-1,2-mannosidase